MGVFTRILRLLGLAIENRDKIVMLLYCIEDTKNFIQTLSKDYNEKRISLEALALKVLAFDPVKVLEARQTASGYKQEIETDLINFGLSKKK